MSKKKYFVQNNTGVFANVGSDLPRYIGAATTKNSAEDIVDKLNEESERADTAEAKNSNLQEETHLCANDPLDGWRIGDEAYYFENDTLKSFTTKAISITNNNGKFIQLHHIKNGAAYSFAHRCFRSQREAIENMAQELESRAEELRKQIEKQENE